MNNTLYYTKKHTHTKAIHKVFNVGLNHNDVFMSNWLYINYLFQIFHLFSDFM